MAILRKVLKVQLHTTVHIKDVGQFGPSMDASEGKLNGIRELSLLDNGRGITITGKGPKGPFEALIPDGNVASMQYDLTPLKPAVNETSSKTQGPSGG